MANSCTVVWADPAEFPASACSVLDAAETARLQGLRRPADRQRFVAAHALARTVLGGVLERDPAALRFVARCATCGGPHGKPALAGGELQFSLSHAGDRVLVAVAAVPVGVDVEVPDPKFDTDELAAVALHPAERAELAGLPRAARRAAVLRTWTRKEALLKADGRGLAVAPDLVRLGADPPALLDWTADARPAAAQFVDLDLGPGRFAALAVLSAAAVAVDLRRGMSAGGTGRPL